MGGVSAQTTQTAKTYTGTIKSGAKLVASDSSNNEIINLTTPKDANYLYFNYKSSFTITVDGTAITLSDASQNQGGQGGPGGSDGPGSQSDQSQRSQSADTTNKEEDEEEEDVELFETNGYFLKSLNIIFIIGLFIF